MHEIRFWPGLRPRPHWGSLQHSFKPLSWIWWGLLLRGGRKRGAVGRGRVKQEFSIILGSGKHMANVRTYLGHLYHKLYHEVQESRQVRCEHITAEDRAFARRQLNVEKVDKMLQLRPRRIFNSTMPKRAPDIPLQSSAVQVSSRGMQFKVN